MENPLKSNPLNIYSAYVSYLSQPPGAPIA